MPDSDSLQTVGKQLRKGSEYASWFAIGEIAGCLLALLIPDTVISDRAVGHFSGTLLSALYGLGLLSRFKSNRGRQIYECLHDADRLFYKGVIDEEEHKLLRRECLTNRSRSSKKR